MLFSSHHVSAERGCNGSPSVVSAAATEARGGAAVRGSSRNAGVGPRFSFQSRLFHRRVESSHRRSRMRRFINSRARLGAQGCVTSRRRRRRRASAECRVVGGFVGRSSDAQGDAGSSGQAPFDQPGPRGFCRVHVPRLAIAVEFKAEDNEFDRFSEDSRQSKRFELA